MFLENKTELAFLEDKNFSNCEITPSNAGNAEEFNEIFQASENQIVKRYCDQNVCRDPRYRTLYVFFCLELRNILKNSMEFSRNFP